MRNSVSIQGTLDTFFVRHGALFQIWRRATCSFTLDRYEEQVQRREKVTRESRELKWMIKT